LGRGLLGWGVGVGALLLSACDKPEPRPDRELLFVTGDSTFWVSVSGNSVRTRGVPMFVARIDGRFKELYVTDDDRSYFDAVFIGHRLYSRDLASGDSIELHSDSVVARLAAEYARTHPEEQRLSPDEPENDNAGTRATSDIEILGIHGPYVSYEHHTDVDTRDERSADHRHEYRRGVLDARNAKAVWLVQLFGQRAADSLATVAREEWYNARDTLFARAGAAAPQARRAISDFVFDAASFALGSEGQAPLVRFAPPARGVNPDLEPIELQPRRVPAPAWWSTAAAELPIAPGDTSRWVHAGDTLVSHLATGPRAWSVSIKPGSGAAQVAARVSSPIERVIWLDSSVTDLDRDALERAFSEAANYETKRQMASMPRLQTPGPLAPAGATSHLARHVHFSLRPARPRVAARVVGADDARGRERAGSCLWRRDHGDARQDRRRLCDAARPDALRHRFG
jgi:hypothetical protein